MVQLLQFVSKRFLIKRCKLSTTVDSLSTETIQLDQQLSSTGYLPTTNQLNIINTSEYQKLPVFRILNANGDIVEGASSIENLHDISISKELAIQMYNTMGRVQSLDDVFYNAQRQGRISFYMQNTGEEGTQVGSASALSLNDTIFAQYREVGVLLWRGFTLQQAADQCFSNVSDNGKGRQMPVHYGSKELNFQTISSPLATQMPQAVGAAYSLKLACSDAVAVCYFGEGAASEGDFHAALNFSSTLEVPILFICRNNGYAISTPVRDQFRGDGIASRAAGYGMHTIRVDGNDILAVRSATAAARALAIEKSCPVLIECMTYRGGHHSTSDDSTRYRSISEIRHWQDHYDPLVRLRKYMENNGWWDAHAEQAMRDRERMNVLNALEKAEKAPKPPLSELFDDVYDTKPQHIIKQEASLHKHIEKYPQHYQNNQH